MDTGLCCSCVKRVLCINNAHCASVSYCSVAGDKTGSKLFLLVQQQLERSYGGKALLPLARLERTAEREHTVSPLRNVAAAGLWIINLFSLGYI